MTRLFHRTRNTVEGGDNIVYLLDRYLFENDSTVMIGGWCFSKRTGKVSISVSGVEARVTRHYRDDLARDFPAYKEQIRNSGFEIRISKKDANTKKFGITFSDGTETVDVPNDRRKIFTVMLRNRVKKLIKGGIFLILGIISALDLGKFRRQWITQFKRHAQLIQPGKAEEPEGVQRIDSDIKYVAFYLPQFHPIKENDEWWGKGFTEWRNVARALPMYVGHYQPHIPSDLGFYDLRNARTIENQVNLARRFGIYGFCFHYYWFGGRRLLEEPLDIFLEHQEIDFPFCICWANETWSRRWDGSENDILMKQDHTEETDLRFIQDAVELFRDKRYIRINERPVLIIYRPDLFPSLPDTIEHWKTYCKEQGMQPPFVIGALTFDIEDPTIFGCDAGVEFPPHGLRLRQITYKKRMLNPKFSGIVFEARNIIQDKLYLESTPFLKFRTVFPGWDNTPRKPEKGFVFEHTSPAFYKEWLKDVSQYTNTNIAPEHRFVFINAWNEWAEGAHLEPDFQYGTGYLEATAEVLKELRTRGDQPAGE